MLIPTPVPPIRHCRGGVAGEEAGVAAGGVDAAGAGLHLTGTRGGKTTNQIFEGGGKDMWPWYRCWHPWGWAWHGHWPAAAYAWPWAPIPKEQEIAMLEDQARMLESELASIRSRLEELKK